MIQKIFQKLFINAGYTVSVNRETKEFPIKQSNGNGGLEYV